MTVAYLVTEYPSRSLTFVRREIAAVRAHGVDVDVLAIRRPPRDGLLAEREVRDHDETWSILPVGPGRLVATHVRMLAAHPVRYVRALALSQRHRNPGAKSALWALFHFTEAVVLAAELRRRRPEHVHVEFATAAAQLMLLAHVLTGVPWSMALHGTCDIEYPAVTLLGPKLEAVEFATCATHFLKAQALRTVPLAVWDRLDVVRCGIELDQLPRRAPREAARPFRVCSVGRLSTEKGGTGLITALAACRAGGLDAELHLVGDGPTRPDVERAIDALGLRAHCHLYGATSEADALQHMADADVLVVPSLMENLPVVLMEAMGIGTPVVAPALAGIPELVEHERTGLLYDPGDWDGLAAAVRRLADDPPLAERLAEEARAVVEREFDITRAVLPLVDRFRA